MVENVEEKVQKVDRRKETSRINIKKAQEARKLKAAEKRKLKEQPQPVETKKVYPSSESEISSSDSIKKQFSWVSY